VGSEQTGPQSEIFTVIGVLADVEVQHESYVSLARMAFVPFSTSCAVFDKDFNTLLLEPRSIEDRDLALHQFRQVMGSRYGFAPEDRNAVVIYFDSIERAKSIRAVFGGLRIFLAAVGIMILGIGALGVMNVVLVSVAARRFEIGLRKALGATPLVIYAQFFTETIIACLSSGLLGFLLGLGCIALLQALPLPEGFSRPVLDLQVALVAFGLLGTVAVAVGLYPARRAAQLEPVDALKGVGT
jgi:putative ABC transport system permease protein